MPALQRSTRRMIFYGMVVFFAIIVPLVLLYSQGYIFDFRGRGLVPTGGIFVKTVQSGARVFVDSEFAKETAFISRGALVTDLLPRRYTVRVEKEGLRPWQKVVRVANEEVVEFRNVFLPPATVTPRVVFTTRTSGGRLVALAGRTDFGVELGDPKQPFSVFVVDPETHVAAINFAKVSRWFWDEASKSFTIERVSGSRRYWYRMTVLMGKKAVEVPVTFRGLPPGFSADRITPHPTDPELFYFFAGGALFLQGRSSVPVPIAEQIHSYAVTPQHLYFISKNGFFAESNLGGGDTKILGRKGLFLNPEKLAEIIVSSAGDVLVVDSAGGLFLYQPGRDEELELVAGNVTGVDFSENGDRVLYWDTNRLWIYWLKENSDQPFDLARSRRQIFYSSEPILRASLNAKGTHVFFATGERLRMTEVDDRAGTNTYDLVEGPIDAFFLDKKNLELYWLRGTVVYRASLQ